MSVHQVSLYYKDGGSDKVYHAQIEKDGIGFLVNFQYGRRGSTLTTGSKTPTAILSEADALKIYEKLIKEKKSKGYTEGESGAVFQSKALEDRFTGIIGQMSNTVRDATIYINDDSFMMEEKKDGQRRLIKIKDGEVTSINKKGLEVLSPEVVCRHILSLGCDVLVDGEIIGDKYFIFDILEHDGQDYRSQTAQERYEFLSSLPLNNIVPAYFTQVDKQAAFDKLENQEKEGVIFKKKNSLYVSGRPNSGGNQLKFKFYSTDTFEVVSHTKNKRSINVVSYQADGTPYDMGNITIPGTTPMPDVGSFVEIRYLYCHEGGKLFQTTYLCVRDDQDKTDCHMRDIKFKPVDEDEE